MTSGRSHRQCRRLQELSTGGSGCSGAATGLQRLDAVVGSGGEVPFAGATVIDRLACQTVLMDGLVVYPVFTVPLSGEPGSTGPDSSSAPVLVAETAGELAGPAPLTRGTWCR